MDRDRNKWTVGGAQAVTYGGTFELIQHELKELGISNTIVDTRSIEGWESALQANSKVAPMCETTSRICLVHWFLCAAIFRTDL